MMDNVSLSVYLVIYNVIKKMIMELVKSALEGFKSTVILIVMKYLKMVIYRVVLDY